jgi:uncharacterized protein (TIGR02996 family)
MADDPDVRTAFMKAILENPLDDNTRLVYADWLQENDEPKFAEYLRVTIEKGICHKARVERGPNGTDVFRIYESVKSTDSSVVRIEKGRGASTRWLPDPYRDAMWLDYTGSGDTSRWWPRSTQFVYERGFIGYVRFGRMDLFDACADYLFRRHPITKVEIGDKSCDNRRNGNFCVWQRQSTTMEAWSGRPGPDQQRYMIPDEYYEEMPLIHRESYQSTYNTFPPDRTTGANWLSDACVTVGRRRAGLCRLPKRETPT